MCCASLPQLLKHAGIIARERGDIGMVGSLGLFDESEYLLKDRFRFEELPRLGLENRQIIQARSGVGVLRAESLLADLQRPLP